MKRIKYGEWTYEIEEAEGYHIDVKEGYSQDNPEKVVVAIMYVFGSEKDGKYSITRSFAEAHYVYGLAHARTYSEDWLVDTDENRKLVSVTKRKPTSLNL